MLHRFMERERRTLNEVSERVKLDLLKTEQAVEGDSTLSDLSTGRKSNGLIDEDTRQLNEEMVDIIQAKMKSVPKQRKETLNVLMPGRGRGSAAENISMEEIDDNEDVQMFFHVR